MKAFLFVVSFKKCSFYKITKINNRIYQELSLLTSKINLGRVLGCQDRRWPRGTRTLGELLGASWRRLEAFLALEKESRGALKLFKIGPHFAAFRKRFLMDFGRLSGTGNIFGT